ncbi:MAG: signal peptidase I [Bacillota bacterium]
MHNLNSFKVYDKVSEDAKNKKASSFSRVIRGFLYIVAICIVIVTLAVVGVFLISQYSENYYLKAYTVVSDSMREYFEAGDLIVVKNVDVYELEVGDIISFYSIDPLTYGEVYTHMIGEITTYDGELAFTTYGTTTGSNDVYPALSSNVIGQQIYVIKNVGEITAYINTIQGYWFLIFIPIVLLIIVEVKNLFMLFSASDEIESD